MLKSLKRPQKEASAADTSATPDVAAFLKECHQRIHRFLDITLRLTEQPLDSVPPSEIREAALAVHRYFSQALPLHVHDEEETLQPRLQGRDPVIDTAISTMHKEHAAHELVLLHFLTLVATLAKDPAHHSLLIAELRPIARELRTQLIAHLQIEEQILFPAIARFCDKPTQAAMIEEMRSRR
jgi:iron-sulfur cluster repair protein YtfE (RIC family)